MSYGFDLQWMKEALVAAKAAGVKIGHLSTYKGSMAFDSQWEVWEDGTSVGWFQTSSSAAAKALYIEQKMAREVQ